MFKRLFRKTSPVELSSDERQELAARRRSNGGAQASGSGGWTTPTNPWNYS